MHMESALVSTGVAIVSAISQGGALGYSVTKLKNGLDKNKAILMGLSGAFVFASQMINFTIPGTGSSGHIAGGILLSVLLGGPAAFITMMSILTVQSLFFGDGGLLALGVNILNLGFIPCLIVYPFIFKPLLRKLGESNKSIIAATSISSIIAVTAGAMAVILETTISGISQLPFTEFVRHMIPIHLAISVAEGLITSFILLLVHIQNKDIILVSLNDKSLDEITMKTIFQFVGLGTIFISGILSMFSSVFPDGLEFSILNTSGVESFKATDSVHVFFDNLQNTIVLMPEYGLKNIEMALSTNLAGVVGSLLTLGIILSIGIAILKNKRDVRF